jgi:hypothetical protein
MWHTIERWSTALLLGSLVLALAQTPDRPPPPPPPQTAQFFAGTVTAVDEEHITVSQKLVGRPTVNRTFLINPQTKMIKPLVVPKAKVTVRYQHVSGADLALEIQVHRSTAGK